jgi:hypothetical protein
MELLLAQEATPEEINKLNTFVELVHSHALDKSDLQKVLVFVENNQDIQPLIEKWLAFSLRRDIQIGDEKDGEK